MIWPLLSGIPNQTVTHMLWRGCVIFELLKAVNALGNVLFITNIQIFLWQKQILLQILKKILEKNWLWGEKVFCCGGKLFLNSSLKHLWEKITSAKHISFALRLARNKQKNDTTTFGHVFCFVIIERYSVHSAPSSLGNCQSEKSNLRYHFP